MASRTIEMTVGKGKDIDSEEWSGKVTQKRIIYGELLKKISDAQEVIKEDTLKGASMMFDLVSDGYPKVDLKYGKHKFTNLSEIYDSQEGQEFVNGSLVAALIKPVSLSKN